MQPETAAEHYMKLYLPTTFLLFAFVFCSSVERGDKTGKIYTDSLPHVDSICNKINNLNHLVTIDSIKTAVAYDSLKKYFSALDFTKADYDSTAYYFPLAGYTSTNIGGKKGNGYIAGRYNYFDGNKHTGHPAHDIFINDSNRDCLDDKTKQHVNVLSFTSGIVVAGQDEWAVDSKLRGGKYLWIYNPYDSTLTYYAHNDTLFVKPGDKVAAGDTIATVGRTGFNAYKQRSPTHLHFMQLKFDKAMSPKPINPYNKLLMAITVK